MAAAARRSALPGLLAVLTATSVLSQIIEIKNVPRGSNITDCSMKCPHPEGYLALYRECGGDEKSRLLDLSCYDLSYTNNYKSRLHVNIGTEFWTLTDAQKNDSCVYNVTYHSNATKVLKTLNITVLDPGSSPSTSSPDGVSTLHWLPWLLVAAPAAIVIVLLAILMVFLVKRRNRRKTKKPEEVEMTVNNMGEHGRPTSSSSETDRYRDQGQKTREESPTRVLSTGNDLTYEEIPQRDEEAGTADDI